MTTDIRSLETRLRHLRTELAFLKAAGSHEELTARGLSLPVCGGLVVPVGHIHLADAELPILAASWHAGPDAPLPWAAKDSRATAAEIREEVAAQDRLGFLVLDRCGRRVGHLGLAKSESHAGSLEIAYAVCEAGRGEMLSEALEAVVLWGHDTLWPELVLGRPCGREQGREFLRGGGFTVDVGGDSSLLGWAVPGERIGKSMILTAGPSISPREAAYVMNAVKYGWNANWSNYLTAFEQRFAKYVGVKHALATSSCTGALHIALAALGIGPGDEVIVPDLTWVATANAVLYVGATPVFADVEPDSWCLDAASFEACITSRTKAVVPVHLYGHPSDMDVILAVARKHGLHVVEDAAPAIGAEYKGRRTGADGDFAAFSFQGAKLAVTGEGGVLVTNDDRLFEKAYTIWDQGRKPGTFWIHSNGVKYKMANPLAALGLAQLERNDAMIEAKRRIFRWYEDGLAGLPHITLNRECRWARSIYWMPSILVHADAPVTRDALRDGLKKRNVDTRAVYPAISQYPIWPVKQSPQPTAARIGSQGINLPSGVCLRREHVAYVCRQIREILS